MPYNPTDPFLYSCAPYPKMNAGDYGFSCTEEEQIGRQTFRNDTTKRTMKVQVSRIR